MKCPQRRSPRTSSYTKHTPASSCSLVTRRTRLRNPIATEFLDFSTVDHRERACHQEVLLNSRLAPESYLGVGHWSDPAGGPAEPVIVMRRYPDSRRLATLVKRGVAVKGELADIAEALATFHNRSHHTRAVDAQGKVGAISARWKENLAELKRFPANRGAARGDRENRFSGRKIHSGP